MSTSRERPEADRASLEAIRKAIRDAVPEAEETISYQIPAFRTGEMAIFGRSSVYTNHLSLACPPPWTEREAFKAQLTPYKMSKSAIQFPKSAPLPSQADRRDGGVPRARSGRPDESKGEGLARTNFA